MFFSMLSNFFPMYITVHHSHHYQHCHCQQVIITTIICEIPNFTYALYGLYNFISRVMTCKFSQVSIVHHIYIYQLFQPQYYWHIGVDKSLLLRERLFCVCRMFNSICGLDPLNAINTSTKLWQSVMSIVTANYPQGRGYVNSNHPTSHLVGNPAEAIKAATT